MKVNYDYYKGEDLYSDGEVEKEILEYVKNTPINKYNDVFLNDMRWPVFYHLTSIRQNMLNWYPFKNNSDILEIGAGLGAMTGVLCKNAKTVTAVELSKQRASVIEAKYQDFENLELIVGNLNDIKFDKKFDYITLIGVFEYANMFTNSENPFDEFLCNIKKLLKDDGKILIAIENQFGMKYFAGAVEDHTSIKYDGILGYANKKGPMTFGKEQIKSILKRNNLDNIRFYYPLPDYKLPNVIFSDECLPTEDDIDNLYDVYYYDKTILNFDEKKAYKEVIKENQFDFFSNSFFIECSKEPLEREIDFAVFNSKNEVDELYMITKNSKGIFEKEKLDFDKKNKREVVEVNSITNILKESIQTKSKENEKICEFFSNRYKTEKENINELEVTATKAINQCDMLKDELEKIYHSRTWKYTGIIRKINRKLKSK